MTKTNEMQGEVAGTSPDPARIGARLRAARRSVGFTIENIAAITGLSASFISKIERDEASPSVPTLVSLCQVLGIEVGALFVAPNLMHVAKESQPMASRVVKGDLREFIVSPRGLSTVQLVHATLGPGTTTGGELFSVQSDFEVLFVIRGQVTVMFTNETVVVSEGESLTLPGGEPHGWYNSANDITAEVMWVLSPAPWARRQGPLS